jgi:hypothetical protein
MSESSPTNIPYWDGKAESFRVYASKIEDYVKFIGIGNTLDPILMAAIDITRSKNLVLVDLYKANKKLYEIIEGGRIKSHGIALLTKTQNDDHPNRLVWVFISSAKKANMPSKESAVIELKRD